jgi:hypothetical protein
LEIKGLQFILTGYLGLVRTMGGTSFALAFTFAHVAAVVDWAFKTAACNLLGVPYEALR